MSMPPSPWAPRPGYQRSSALPQTSTDPGPLPGTGQRYQVHRENRDVPRSPSSDLDGSRRKTARRVSLIPSSVSRKVGAVLYISAIIFFSLCTPYLFTSMLEDYSPLLLPAFQLALIPLGLVLAATMLLAGIFWYLRWEPSPPVLFTAATLGMTFLWGTSISTLSSMVVNEWVLQVITEAMGSPDAASVISAPLVEELTKGLGVLFVFLIWRRTINGVIDGVVYAAFVAAGFAFVENILYFVRFWDRIDLVFQTRGLYTPFAHLTFTAFTGVALGVASRMRSRHAWAWMAPVGLVGAMLLHAFWNGFIAEYMMKNFDMYLFLQILFYAACAGLVAWLRWAERRSMSRGIEDYARSGWFAPDEVQMLTTGAGRRSGRRWAAARGPQASAAMNAFQKDAAELAQLRHKAADDHTQADFSTRETELLDRITSARRTLTRAW